MLDVLQNPNTTGGTSFSFCGDLAFVFAPSPSVDWRLLKRYPFAAMHSYDDPRSRIHRDAQACMSPSLARLQGVGILIITGSMIAQFIHAPFWDKRVRPIPNGLCPRVDPCSAVIGSEAIATQFPFPSTGKRPRLYLLLVNSSSFHFLHLLQ